MFPEFEMEVESEQDLLSHIPTKVERSNLFLKSPDLVLFFFLIGWNVSEKWVSHQECCVDSDFLCATPLFPAEA